MRFVTNNLPEITPIITLVVDKKMNTQNIKRGLMTCAALLSIQAIIVTNTYGVGTVWSGRAEDTGGTGMKPLYDHVVEHNGEVFVAYSTGGTSNGDDTDYKIGHRNSSGVWTTTKIDDGEYDSGHTEPSLIADGDGYLHIFYDLHNSNLQNKYKRSNAPWSITSGFTADFPFTGDSSKATYPYLGKVSNGDIYMSIRVGPFGSTNRGYRTYHWDDSANTWYEKSMWLQENGYVPYIFDSYAEGNNVHYAFSWSVGGASAIRHTVGYARYDSTNNKYYKADGTEYSLPITRSSQDTVQGLLPGEVWSSATYGARALEVTINGSGQPCVLFNVPTDLAVLDDRNVRMGRWNGSSWVLTDVYTGGDHNQNKTAEFYYADGELRLIGELPENTKKFWRSTNNGVSWSSEDITTPYDFTSRANGVHVNGYDYIASGRGGIVYKIDPDGSGGGGGPSSVTLEGESQTWTSSDGVSNISDYVKVEANSSGDWGHFTSNIAAGTYTVKVVVRKSNSGGQWDFDLGGTNMGSIDGYSSTTTYVTMDMGSYTFSGGNVQFRFDCTGKNASASDFDLRIDKIILEAGSSPPPSAITMEGEDQSWTSSDGATDISDYVKVQANSSGDWGHYTKNITAGTYDVKVVVRKSNSGGQWDMEIGGVSQGSNIDGYSSTTTYVTVDMGSRTFSGGNIQFRFDCTGKNASSSDFDLRIDKIILE